MILVATSVYSCICVLVAKNVIKKSFPISTKVFIIIGQCYLHFLAIGILCYCHSSVFTRCIIFIVVVVACTLS